MNDIENDKKEFTSPHGNGTERSVSKQDYRYVSIWGVSHVDNFDKNLIGRILTFKLTDNTLLVGKLKGFGMYDILVTDSKTGRDFIIMKSAIISIEGDFSVKKEMVR
jgi:small nuclear ribonucleoprotein (snRNP)-like protein